MIIHIEFWFYVAAALLFIAFGGFTSRMAAGGWPSKYCPIPGQWFFALPYLPLFWIHSTWYWGVASYIGAAIGLRQASYPYTLLGDVMPVDTTRKPPLDFIVCWFFGSISPTGGQYWRNVAGLTVEGLADCIPTGALYAHFISPFGGLVVALAGLTRAPAYMIESGLRNKGLLPASMSGVLGDILRGAFLYGALVLAWVL